MAAIASTADFQLTKKAKRMTSALQDVSAGAATRKSVMVATDENSYVTATKDGFLSMFETAWEDPAFDDGPEQKGICQSRIRQTDDGNTGIASVVYLERIEVGFDDVYHVICKDQDFLTKKILFGEFLINWYEVAEISETQRITYGQFEEIVLPGVPMDSSTVETEYPDIGLITYNAVETSLVPVEKDFTRDEDQCVAYQVIDNGDGSCGLYFGFIAPPVFVTRMLLSCCGDTMRSHFWKQILRCNQNLINIKNEIEARAKLG